MNDLLGGNIVAIFASAPTAIPFIEAGRLRALATTGVKRSDSLPNIPTVAEQGYPGYQAPRAGAWRGTMAASRRSSCRDCARRSADLTVQRRD